jgi:hypothetical protein
MADLARQQHFQSAFPADDFALRRQYRRDLNQILVGYSRLAQCLLERFELVFVSSDPFGQEDFCGNKIYHQVLLYL